jgi:hypothetical protein
MADVVSTSSTHPEPAILLTLAAGFVLGRHENGAQRNAPLLEYVKHHAVGRMRPTAWGPIIMPSMP